MSLLHLNLEHCLGLYGSGCRKKEAESDSCLRASLERPMGTRTSQQIGEGGQARAAGSCPGSSNEGLKVQVWNEPLSDTWLLACVEWEPSLRLLLGEKQ